jgi:hypothetical protein
MMRKSALVLAGVLLTTGCSETLEPSLGTLAYEIFTGCLVNPDGPYTCTPNQTAVARGDTLFVGHAVVDTADATGTLSHITIRAVCAVNFEIRRGAALVATLPEQPTCPDSTLAQGINAPRVLNITIYIWAVPTDLTPGTYVLRSVWLEDPQVTRSLQVTVR